MKILEWLFPKRNREQDEPGAPALAQILPKLTAFKKRAYVPIVEDGD